MTSQGLQSCDDLLRSILDSRRERLDLGPLSHCPRVKPPRLQPKCSGNSTYADYSLLVTLTAVQLRYMLRSQMSNHPPEHREMYSAQRERTCTSLGTHARYINYSFSAHLGTSSAHPRHISAHRSFQDFACGSPEKRPDLDRDRVWWNEAHSISCTSVHVESDLSSATMVSAHCDCGLGLALFYTHPVTHHKSGGRVTHAF